MRYQPVRNHGTTCSCRRMVVRCYASARLLLRSCITIRPRRQRRATRKRGWHIVSVDSAWAGAGLDYWSRSRTAKHRAGAHGGLPVARASRCALPSSPFPFCAPALPLPPYRSAGRAVSLIASALLSATALNCNSRSVERQQHQRREAKPTSFGRCRRCRGTTIVYRSSLSVLPHC